MTRDYSAMSIRELEGLRSVALDRIGSVPAFRRGSLQVGYRKCGKKTCRCARPGERGHGPRGLWTRTAKGAGSRGQYIPVEQVDQVREELENYAQFAELIEDYVEINEALCKARVGPPGRPRERRTDPALGGEKGGSAARAGAK
ncbi:DUF6788 family protein [Pseudactinotalea sp. Z1732]|uniref:DUF6788 family protein n=1 Tax=Micrococcales TaxID=85006 RepID=UPI003C7BE6B2